MIKIVKREISKKQTIDSCRNRYKSFWLFIISKKIVDNIKSAGAEAVKVQIHIPEEEMCRSKKIIPGNSKKNIFKIISENSLL